MGGEQHLPSPIAFVSISLAHNPYLASILAGVADTLAQHGYPLLVYGSVNSTQCEDSFVREAMARGVHGIIVYPWPEYHNFGTYQLVLKSGLPLIQVDRYYPGLPVDYVVWDDYAAGYEATVRLIRQGHRQIAFVPTGETRLTAVRNRIAGFRQALEDHGLGFDEDMIWVDMAAAFPLFRPNHDQKGGSRALPSHDVVQMLARHLERDAPTALIAANDSVAYTFLPILEGLAAGDSPLAERASGLAIATTAAACPSAGMPHISVVAIQHGQILGARAAELLIQRLQGTVPSDPQHIVESMPVVECKLS